MLRLFFLLVQPLSQTECHHKAIYREKLLQPEIHCFGTSSLVCTAHIIAHASVCVHIYVASM